MYKISPARERVLARLLQGPATVEQLADELGSVPVTLRGHLTALQEQGLVDAEDERGRVGRPRRWYRLSQNGRDRLPNRNAGLSGDLLECLQTLTSSRGVDQLLDVAAARYAGRHASQTGGPSLEERVAAVADVLQQEGGLARWEAEPERFLIRDFHCPYGAAVERPEICRYHTQVVTRLVGAPVRLEKSMAEGAPHCLFAVQRGPLRSPAAVRTLSDGRVGPQRGAAKT